MTDEEVLADYWREMGLTPISDKSDPWDQLGLAMVKAARKSDPSINSGIDLCCWIEAEQSKEIGDE